MIALEAPKITFVNARIVGEKVNPVDHHQQEFKRGEIGFVMSRGELMRFNECPIKWIESVPEGRTAAMEWGDLIDCLWLVPNQFSNRFAVCPETYPDTKTGDPKPWNFNANFCKQWREDQGDVTIIKHDLRQEAEKALAKFFSLDLGLRVVTDGTPTARHQVALSAEYFDRETELQIPIRALIDIVPPVEFELGNSLVDLKTASSAEPRAWSKQVGKEHYDAQAGLYLDLWNAATGEERIDFRHIIQENEAPYHIELRMLSQEFIELGRLKYRSALKKYCQCLASGEWPGYDNGHHPVFGRWSLCEPEPYMVNQ